MQPCGYRQVGYNKGHIYSTEYEFLREIRYYTSMSQRFPDASTDQATAGGRSEKPRVAGLLEGISEITRRGILQEGISGLPQSLCQRNPYPGENNWKKI